MKPKMFDYIFDHHVHIGQFQDVYYNPYKMVDILLNCGVIGAYISSTTSCIDWDTKQEKEILISHIKAEIKELLSYSKERNFDAKPLCWIIPQRYYEGETVDEIYSECDYQGFKIHPRAHDWDLNKKMVVMLLSDICKIAEQKNVPVLIHTGICEFESPSKFKYWFETFPNVKFILAHCCRDVNKILDLFDTYKNLYGDVAFSKPEDLQPILYSKHRNRLLFGTDFPITAHNQSMKKYKKRSLYKNYKQILSVWNEYDYSFTEGRKELNDWNKKD